MNKPDLLFHGTVEKNLKEIFPKPSKLSDSVIFATPYIPFATTFLVDSDDSWIKPGIVNVNGENLYYIAISDKEKFLKQDNGGSIYIVDNITFEKSAESKDDAEWIGKNKIKPLACINFHSALETMIQNWVQVYFVEEKTFGEIKNLDKECLKILKSLKSENEERNLNVFQF